MQRLTLADRVYQALEEEILTGSLAAGRFVRTQEVSSSLQISPTPVREALGRLASVGLLERIPHRGYRVPRESVFELLNLDTIVSTLEIRAGQLSFPELGAEDLEELRAINAELKQALKEGNAEQAVECDTRFHAAISRRSGNPRLTDLLKQLHREQQHHEKWYYSNPDHGEVSVREHDALIRALELGDTERALEILEHNMSLTREALLAQASRSTPPET